MKRSATPATTADAPAAPARDDEPTPQARPPGPGAVAPQRVTKPSPASRRRRARRKPFVL